MTDFSEIRFARADVGELTLHYATAGSGEKLVILLHGFPEFWYSWRHQILDLSSEYTVVAPDMRGFNLSDKPLNASDYTIDHLVGDIAGLIKYFGREKTALIGHDWGASVAWALAMSKPELLWKLGALQVPPIPIWKRNQTVKQLFASWYMFFFQLPMLPEFILQRDDNAALARSLTGSTATTGVFTAAEIAQYKKAWSQPGAATAMLNYYRANIIKRLFGTSEMPPKINIPTLFIYGEKDQAVLPETVAGVGDLLSGPFTEHRISDSGHWVQQEARHEVARVLREFLAE